MIHAQLPLRVPCYDLAHVTEPRLTPPSRRVVAVMILIKNISLSKLIYRDTHRGRGFAYSRLPWLDGQVSSRNLELMFPPHGRISRMRRAQCIFCLRRKIFCNPRVVKCSPFFIASIISQKISKSTLSLPIYPLIYIEKKLEYILEKLMKF